VLFFEFPEDARWNAGISAIEFGIGVGEYEGVVRVPRRVFQGLLGQSPRPNGVSKPITSRGLGSN